jgi:uncharacterized protein (DUF1330 family)
VPEWFAQAEVFVAGKTRIERGIMSAYVIVDIEVTDPDGYEEYKNLAAPSVSAHGGRYLVRGGTVECLEGYWETNRFVLLEFRSAEQARKWWDSPEYRVAKGIRRRTARTKMILVEGA